mgnify:CR=1 FL=1
MKEKKAWTADEVRHWYTSTGHRNYYNPADSNWIVRKPNGLGWTMNLANIKTWLFAAVLALALLLTSGR